jgi:hypothetical protein
MRKSAHHFVDDLQRLSLEENGLNQTTSPNDEYIYNHL